MKYVIFYLSLFATAMCILATADYPETRDLETEIQSAIIRQSQQKKAETPLYFRAHENTYTQAF